MKLLLFFSIMLLFTIGTVTIEKEQPLLEGIIWYGQSSIKIERGGMTIFVDPWQIPASENSKADIILITHDHFDHYSAKDIKRILKQDTEIFAPMDISKNFSKNTTRVIPNKSYKAKEILIETVPAYNLTKTYHPKKSDFVGYIVTISHIRYYFAGDTDFIPEMKGIKCDVAFLPIGGTYTMDKDEALKAVDALHPKLAVPYHYATIEGVGVEQDGTYFKAHCKVPCVIMKKRL